MKRRRLLALLLAPCTLALAAPPATAPSTNPISSIARALTRGDKDEALRLADAALTAEPKNLALLAARASVHEARREFEPAVADYTKLIELAPTEAGAYQRRGEDRFRLGQFKESVADFDLVIQLDPAREPYH